MKALHDIPLTERETQVVQHVCNGYTNREMGGMLGISVKTVEAHRANLMKKIRAVNAAQVMRWAISTGAVKL